MKGMPNMGQIMKQAQQIQSKMAKLQEDLGDRTVESSSGGGMVTVTLDGTKGLISIRIDPKVVNKEDIEMLQDLIVAAFNDAGTKVDENASQKLGSLGAALKIPGLF